MESMNKVFDTEAGTMRPMNYERGSIHCIVKQMLKRRVRSIRHCR